MAENKTDHMLNIANFLSQILPQQHICRNSRWMDINQLSQQMDIVWKIKTFLRANVAAKTYRFARTFRLVENRLSYEEIKVTIYNYLKVNLKKIL